MEPFESEPAGLNFCCLNNHETVSIKDESVVLNKRVGLAGCSSTSALGLPTRNIQAVHAAIGGRRLARLVVYWGIAAFVGAAYYLMVPAKEVDEFTTAELQELQEKDILPPFTDPKFVTKVEKYAQAKRTNDAFQAFLGLFVLLSIVWFFSRFAFSSFSSERAPVELSTARARHTQVLQVTDVTIRDMLTLSGKAVDPALMASAAGDESARDARWTQRLKNKIAGYGCVTLGSSELRIGRHYLQIENRNALCDWACVAARYISTTLTESVAWVRRSEAPKYKAHQIRMMMVFALFVSLYSVQFRPGTAFVRWAGTCGGLWVLIGVLYFLSRRYHVAVAFNDKSTTELQVAGEDDARMMMGELFSQKLGYDSSNPLAIKSWLVTKCFKRSQKMITLYTDRIEYYSVFRNPLGRCGKNSHTYTMALKDVEFVHAEVAGALKRMWYAALFFGALAFGIGFVMHFMVGTEGNLVRNVMAGCFGLWVIDVFFIIVFRPTFIYVGTVTPASPGGLSPFALECTTIGEEADAIVQLILSQAKFAKDAAEMPTYAPGVTQDEASLATGQSYFAEQYAWAPYTETATGRQVQPTEEEMY